MLPDREATSLARWLREHPGVTIVSLDRAGAYADGVRKGAPTAVQVADRYHLLLNLRQTIKGLLDRQGTCLPSQAGESSIERSGLVQEPIQLTVVPSLQYQEGLAKRRRTMSCLPYRSAPPSAEDVRRQARRSQRLARYKAVRTLHQQGLSLEKIARQLELSLRTVRRCVRAESFPELSPWPKQGSKLDPYVPYLLSRWQGGYYNGTHLYHELLAQGYPGSRVLVSRFIAELRRKSSTGPDPKLISLASTEKALRELSTGSKDYRSTQSTRQRLSSQQVSWLFVCSPARLKEKQQTQLDQLCQTEDQWRRVYQLAQQFVSLFKERQPEALDTWLKQAERSALPEFQRFTQGLRRDYAAVRAACSLPWSTGQVEGQITRLKLLKRQMYGRAKFDLLRLRVLHAA